MHCARSSSKKNRSIEVILRICHGIPLTNYSDERSFSFKRIKTYLELTYKYIYQEKLNGFAALAIHEIVKKIELRRDN